MCLSSLVAACHSQLFDPITAMYGGGMGMYGNYNPFLYGFGGANNLLMNPLMDSMAMGPYGANGMLGATLGMNSVNPYGAYFNSQMLSNYGSAGSPFGRQFRSRYGGRIFTSTTNLITFAVVPYTLGRTTTHLQRTTN